MNQISNVEQAERLSRKRARMLPVLAVVYLTQQASFFADSPAAGRSVDHVKIGAWLILSLVLLLAISTNGFWFRSREVRALLDDESTRANRLTATSAGFFAAMLAAILLYLVDQFEPIATRETIHIILSVGLAAALIRFGMLERRAHSDG
ncbi:MAG: hypothetical protein ABI626_10540 [Sphingomicrobium sp.]